MDVPAFVGGVALLALAAVVAWAATHWRARRGDVESTTSITLEEFDEPLLLARGARSVIGRDPDCDWVLDDQMVSRRHGVFEKREDGVYYTDLASQNGTLLNAPPEGGRRRPTRKQHRHPLLLRRAARGISTSPPESIMMPPCERPSPSTTTSPEPSRSGRGAPASRSRRSSMRPCGAG